MITIKYNEDKVTIKGHANYRDDLDIVCASISSIMYTTVNACLKLDSKSIEYIDDNTVTINILKKDKTTNTLIENMIALFMEISSEYPKNVKVESEE